MKEKRDGIIYPPIDPSEWREHTDFQSKLSSHQRFPKNVGVIKEELPTGETQLSQED